jgi:hypothetical protein
MGEHRDRRRRTATGPITWANDPSKTAAASTIMQPHLARALAEGVTPAAVADLVATSIEEDRYWVFPHPDWMDMVSLRWEQIGEGMNPEAPAQVPGMPPFEQIVAEIQASLTGDA